MNEPRDNESPAKAVRASDDERERVAKLVSDAAGEGRLTLAEADERMNLIYHTKFRDELDRFVSDLPAGIPAERPRRAAPPATRLAAIPTRLRVHAVVAVVLSVFLITRWVASDVPFFWPAGPMFFLFGSLLLHARVVYWSNRGGPTRFRRWELGPSRAQGDGYPAGRGDGGKGQVEQNE